MKREQEAKVRGAKWLESLARRFSYEYLLPGWNSLSEDEQKKILLRAHCRALRRWQVWLAALMALSTVWLVELTSPFPLTFFAGMGAAWVLGHYKSVYVFQEVAQHFKNEHP